MSDLPIIDALYRIPNTEPISQIAECSPSNMAVPGTVGDQKLSGIVIGPCSSWNCRNYWNCSERQTKDVQRAVQQSPVTARALAAFDPLRIAQALRRIHDGHAENKIFGALVQADSCARGIDSKGLYPLYGVCAELKIPVVLAFARVERWDTQYSRIAEIASDIEELKLIVVPPPEARTDELAGIADRYPNVYFILAPWLLAAQRRLLRWVEGNGSAQALYSAGTRNYDKAAEMLDALSLPEDAKRRYLAENARVLYGFAA